MVDSKSGTLQWDIPYQSTTSSSTNRCVRNRLSGSDTGKVHQRGLDMLGENVAYQ